MWQQARRESAAIAADKGKLFRARRKFLCPKTKYVFSCLPLCLSPSLSLPLYFPSCLSFSLFTCILIKLQINCALPLRCCNCNCHSKKKLQFVAALRQQQEDSRRAERGGEDKIAGSFSELSLSGGLAKRCGQRDRTELQVKQNKTSSSYSIVDSANAVKDRQTEGETDGRQIER